mmetsp:Transcript_42368/g.69853  ORF Transcript_42368/g.69853 Transcript_42368/m.69853 type:complete len:279 (-) Transcript_42368:367-1203(-)
MCRFARHVHNLLLNIAPCNHVFHKITQPFRQLQTAILQRRHHLIELRRFVTSNRIHLVLVINLKLHHFLLQTRQLTQNLSAIIICILIPIFFSRRRRCRRRRRRSNIKLCVLHQHRQAHRFIIFELGIVQVLLQQGRGQRRLVLLVLLLLFFFVRQRQLVNENILVNARNQRHDVRILFENRNRQIQFQLHQASLLFSPDNLLHCRLKLLAILMRIPRQHRLIELRINGIMRVDARSHKCLPLRGRALRAGRVGIAHLRHMVQWSGRQPMQQSNAGWI